jgi:hypothetical protein
MSDEVKVNPNEVLTQDAQLLAENIASGVEKTPQVDFEADYAAAQAMSVSEIDKTQEGAKAAEVALAPKFQIPEAEDKMTEAVATGNPSDYMDMADDIASGNEAVTNVSDDLLQKAFDMGKPGGN